MSEKLQDNGAMAIGTANSGVVVMGGIANVEFISWNGDGNATRVSIDFRDASRLIEGLQEILKRR